MVVLVLIAICFLSDNPIYCEELAKQYLNIGIILEANDDISKKVLDFAVQDANNELAKHNYVLEIKSETLEEINSFSVIRKGCNLVQSGIIAMISLTSAIPSRHISSLCNRFHIPHMLTSCRFPDSSGDYSFDIKLHPDCDQYANIIYQYISQIETWKNVMIIHSENNCILKFEYYLNQFESYFRIKQWVPGDLRKNKRFMKELSVSKKFQHFLVDIPYWQIKDFLIMAAVHNLTGFQYSFLFTDWDANLADIVAFKMNNKMNITTLTILNQTSIDTLKINDPDLNALLETIAEKERSTKKRNIRENFMSQTAILIDTVRLLAKSIISLVKSRPINAQSITCSSNDTWIPGSSLFNVMTSTENLHGITGRLVFNEKAQRKDYSLTIMELTENGFSTSGHWIKDKLVMLQKNTDPFLSEMTNNKPLRVTTIINAPFVFYKDGEQENHSYDTSIEAWNGFCIDILNEIGKDLELNFTIHLVKDGKFGTVIPNETNPDGSEKWSGMIGELISGDADLAVGPMTISYEREKVVDFTTPFMSLGLSIMFLKPQKETPGLFSFLSPLSLKVWLYVISAYISVSLIIFFISHVTPYEWLRIHPCGENCNKRNQFNLLNSLWFTVAALMRQGLEFCPQASSTRVVSGTWWFFTLIIISTYTANLAAFLTVEQLILPIKSVEDLLNQTKIKYGILRSGTSEAFFEKALIPTYQKMFEVMKQNPDVFVDSTPEGVEKVRNSNGKYAFLLESAMNDYYGKRDCDLIRVGDLLDSKGYGIGFPTGSHWRDNMTVSILKLQKSQKLGNLIHKWWSDLNVTKPCDDKEKGSRPTSLNVNQVGGVFFLLGAGFICACAVSVIELYIEFRNKRCYWKIPFYQYLKMELQFAMRFMSSSKKPIKLGLEFNRCKETTLMINSQSSRINDLRKACQNVDHGSNKLEITPRIFIDIDCPSEDLNDCYSTTRDTFSIIPNLYILNNNL